MKRHKQLQPLSRQHHNGLLAALLLKKGIKKLASTNVMANFIIDLWNNDLDAHFNSEENILIPALKGSAFDEALTKRLLNEHLAMRSYIHSLQNGFIDMSIIEDFVSLLEEHIRFEERIFFPAAEKILTEEQLHEIGALLYENNELNCIDHAIKFWE